MSCVKKDQKKVSIVISVYNEEGNIEELYSQLSEQLSYLPEIRYEIIFVNDGSKDSSLKIMKSILEKDSNIRIVNLSRNYGHEIAMTAGMDYAVGDCVVFMDSDLQHPPPIVPKMIKHWQAGSKMVLTKRVENKGQFLLSKILNKLFYKLLNFLSDVDIPENTPDFRLLDRKYIEILGNLKENNRMFRGLISWLGVPNPKIIEFVAPVRLSGKTKYSIDNLFLLALDSIISFSIKPLRVATYIGIICALISMCLGAHFIYGIINDENYSYMGYGTTITMIIFIGSVQLIVLGIIGEYLGRIHLEVKNRPLYVGEYLVNAEDDKG